MYLWINVTFKVLSEYGKLTAVILLTHFHYQHVPCKQQRHKANDNCRTALSSGYCMCFFLYKRKLIA